MSETPAEAQEALIDADVEAFLENKPAPTEDLAEFEHDDPTPGLAPGVEGQSPESLRNLTSYLSSTLGDDVPTPAEFAKTDPALAGSLKRAWGGDYDLNVRLVQSALSSLPPALVNAGVKAGLDKDVGLLSALAKRELSARRQTAWPGIYATPADHGEVGERSDGVEPEELSATERARLERARQKAVGQSIDANRRGDRDEAKRLADIGMRLATRLYGDKPADGSLG